MKNATISFIGFLLVAMILGTPQLAAQPQSIVSNNNEDEVYRLSKFAPEFVPGQVLVKFKDASGVNFRKVAGKFQAPKTSAINTLISNYAVSDVRQLFPNEKPTATPRRAKAYNGDMVVEKDLSNIYLFKLNTLHTDSTLQLINELKQLDEVEYAEPNYYAYISTTSNSKPVIESLEADNIETTDTSAICLHPELNPLFVSQWGIQAMGLDVVWRQPIINKKRPIIAILDTGVDINHPDLKDNIWTNEAELNGETGQDDDGNGIVDDVHGYNFVNLYDEIVDNNGHGTHCAGIAAAADNGKGIVGANPKALIMPVKVLDDKGQGDYATIAQGILYAARNGADVISMSFGGGPQLSQTLANALDQAYFNCILVAAAGNNGREIYDNSSPLSPGTIYPGAYKTVLGVQSTADALDNLSGFSNYDPDGGVYTEDGMEGRNYEVKAPGSHIISTYPGGKYAYLSGTSMATPMMAGAISALKMVRDYASNDELYSDLIYTDSKIDKMLTVERHPVLDLVSLQITDTIAGCNNDGVADAGETIEIYPVLRNSWGTASNITMHLDVPEDKESLVQVENADVDFGWSLSAFGHNTSKHPFRVKINPSVGDGAAIKLNVTINCPDLLAEESHVTKTTYLHIENQIKLNGLVTDSVMVLKEGNTYYINDNLAVPDGHTLVIEPGTRLEFAKETYLSSFGKLIANGTPEKPIIMTLHNADTDLGYWGGIASKKAEECRVVFNNIYSNADSTLFTLQQTKFTPFPFMSANSSHSSPSYQFNSDKESSSPSKIFKLSEYVDAEKCRALQFEPSLASDTNFITPAVRTLLSDWSAWNETCRLKFNEGEQTFTNFLVDDYAFIRYDYPKQDTISYCKISRIDRGAGYRAHDHQAVMYNCELSDCGAISLVLVNAHMCNFNGIGTERGTDANWLSNEELLPIAFCNITNFCADATHTLPKYKNLLSANYFNNKLFDVYKNTEEKYWLNCDYSKPTIEKVPYPSYLGTAREDLVRPHIYEMGNGSDGFGKVDLSNMRKEPVHEAHGIVWKVVVDGYDAQDEFEQLPPLGVGRHKFEVWFNRPMNVKKTPNISFGLRDPFTQIAVADSGNWSTDSTRFTAYVNITGKTSSDGYNTIYVRDAEDNEFFECPYENTRFHVVLQAAGSLATGFEATPGLGKVRLDWNNENNDFDDAMGFNVYRYTVDTAGVASDTIAINRSTVAIDDTTYTDYNVLPGQTYYYFYRVLNTDLKEYDVSNTVACTPLTSIKGDANGSMAVDVADVVTEISYMTHQDPKPFIFEAADVNADQAINVLDVVGTINIIKDKARGEAASAASIASTATYTVEGGTLYVDCAVPVAGLQLTLGGVAKADAVTPMAALEGMELVNEQLNDSSRLLLAYSMSGGAIAAGKHALLSIGSGKVSQIMASDEQGHNIIMLDGNAAGIGAVEAAQLREAYPNPFTAALNVPYVIGKASARSAKMVVRDLTGRTVAIEDVDASQGSHTFTWQASGTARGAYFVSLVVDGKLVQTARAIKR